MLDESVATFLVIMYGRKALDQASMPRYSRRLGYYGGRKLAVELILRRYFGSEADNREQQKHFLQKYQIRTSLERLIYKYAHRPIDHLSMSELYSQSRELLEATFIDRTMEAVEKLLVFNARGIGKFRRLPYLVVLNPSICDSYNIYLKTMSNLLKGIARRPKNLEENEKLIKQAFQGFIDEHADTIPTLSKGFSEVRNLVSTDRIKGFLDDHLKERIHMRLIAHQQIALMHSLKSPAFVPGGDFNGIIKPLDIKEVIQKNADLVNSICAIKYDQTVPIVVDTNLYPPSYWSGSEPNLTPRSKESFIFPYIEYHLDYVLMELLKNAFRAHIENGVKDPVHITVSISSDPSYMELRIRDKGKGIHPKALKNMFDYSFTTYESNEGDSYKTLNAPPGVEGQTIAGMGYGLPLLKNYIEAFNYSSSAATKGLLTLQTYKGWGTDVYVKTVGY